MLQDLPAGESKAKWQKQMLDNGKGKGKSWNMAEGHDKYQCRGLRIRRNHDPGYKHRLLTDTAMH
jgi:hypothetical protein